MIIMIGSSSRCGPPARPPKPNASSNRCRAISSLREATVWRRRLTMPLGVSMDVHVPLAISQGLRRRNIDALTSQEDETTERDDDSLLARASDLGRLLFTQDEDFL